ncbi:MAG: class I SAM-dependent methyltransferase [Candidatus Cyclobacteriaceae bacterium M2_1C_046]
MTDHRQLNKSLGNLDLFLLDQILKGRFADIKTLLDAGCGEGRNLKYFIDNNYSVTGIDPNAEALQFARLIFRGKAEFIQSTIEHAEFKEKFDSIICINTLHHAADEQQYMAMLEKLTATLKSRGFLFIRTLLGGNGAFKKDKENNLLISDQHLIKLFAEFKLQWLEPLKVESWEQYHLGVIAVRKN